MAAFWPFVILKSFEVKIIDVGVLILFRLPKEMTWKCIVTAREVCNFILHLKACSSETEL